MKSFPNFIIIGAPKSATTSLYYYLKEHPKIFMPKNKEPHFFSFEGQEIQFNGPGDEKITKKMIVTDFSEYTNLFLGASRDQITGEASAMYLHSKTAPERIKEINPDVKLIAILRNPVDRAYSSFNHLKRDAREPEKDFITALHMEDERKKKNWMPIWYYREMGLYSDQLNQYFKFFNREQIHIFIYEEIISQIQTFVKELYEWLGVDADFNPTLDSKFNISGKPKSQRLHTFFRGKNNFKTLLKPFINEKARKSIQNWLINQNLKTPPPLSTKQRKTAYAYFEKDIQSLEHLLQKDFTIWKP